MGIKGLRTFIRRKVDDYERKTYRKKGVYTRKLYELKDKIVAIDASNTLWRHKASASSIVTINSKINYRLLKNGMYPLFIFDLRQKNKKDLNEEQREMMEEKKKTVQKRYNLRKKNENYLRLYEQIEKIRNDEDVIMIDEYDNKMSIDDFRNKIEEQLNIINETTTEITQKIRIEDLDIEHLYSCTVENIIEKKTVLEKMSVSLVNQDFDYCQSQLKSYNIKYMESYFEADSLMARLCELDIIDGVISDDSDLLVFNCPVLYTDFSLHSDEVTELRIDEILEVLNLSYNQFVDMCILFGNDFNERLRMSQDDIYEYIKTYKTIEETLDYLQTSRICNIKNFDKFKERCINTRNIFYRRTPEYMIELAKSKLGFRKDSIEELRRKIQSTYQHIYDIVEMQRTSAIFSSSDNYEEVRSISSITPSNSDDSSEELKTPDSSDIEDSSIDDKTQKSLSIKRPQLFRNLRERKKRPKEEEIDLSTINKFNLLSCDDEDD